MKRPYAKRSLGSFECLCVSDALSLIEQSCRASACLDLGDRVGSPRECCSQEINNIRFSATKIHPGYISPWSHRYQPNCLSRNVGRCDQILRFPLDAMSGTSWFMFMASSLLRYAHQQCEADGSRA